MDNFNHDKGRKIFISYVSEDFNLAQMIYQKLKENYFDPWIDKEGILGGELWNDKIAKIMKESDVIIICLSKNSVKKEGVFQKEINYALELAKEKPEDEDNIIPLRFDKCDVPTKLRHIQWIDYFGENGFEKLLKSLNKIIPWSNSTHEKKENLSIPHDHKINDLGYSPYSEYPGCEIAVRLTPIQYPTVIKKVKFYITCDQEPWSDFQVYIYSANGIKPGRRLTNGNILGKDGNGDKWVEIDVYDEKIVINEGDFFVSMVWLKAPGKYGEQAQFIGGEMNMYSPGRTCFKYDKNDIWWLKNRINCMVRAVDSLGNEIAP